MIHEHTPLSKNCWIPKFRALTFSPLRGMRRRADLFARSKKAIYLIKNRQLLHDPSDCQLYREYNLFVMSCILFILYTFIFRSFYDPL